jgi:arsenite methyltransferase
VNADSHAERHVGPGDATEIKQCCTRLYESELVSRLLGDSFHPGGARLTERLGHLLHLSPDSLVLDVACGRGGSALLLARRFGCSVVGVDLSAENLQRAAAEATALALTDRVRFEMGDAERLPLEDASVDAIICECAFCTFPDKPAAAREFWRVLKPGGLVGLSDITRDPDVPAGELSDLLAWIACLADARSASDYRQWLTDAGLTSATIEEHQDALEEMIRAIGARLFATEVLAGLKKIDLTGIDLPAAKRLARQAMTAVAGKRLGYAIVCAAKPSR